VFSIQEKEVWAIAEKCGFTIPEEKKEEVISAVKKDIESYCTDGAYTIWDLISDSIRDVLDEDFESSEEE